MINQLRKPTFKEEISNSKHLLHAKTYKNKEFWNGEGNAYDDTRENEEK